MKEEILKKIEYLKECKGIEGTKLENLGRSTYDKIKSIISDPNKILTHLYIPKGSEEKVKALQSRFKEVFNTEINPELLSFYQCFDGFEIRYVNPRKVWKEIDKEEIDVDWDELDISPEEITYEDIYKEEYEEVKDAFLYLINLQDNQIRFERLSDPNKSDDFLFYGENIEVEDYGVKTLIPPADFFLSDKNKLEVYETNSLLFYFNFHASFRQRVYGIHNDSLGVHIATSHASEVTKDQGDDMRLYFKKYLIRSY
ncbi:hypothetical protein [Mesoflavibacter zeaxanthinifaciens]|uniref:hypothetical protein n=1 Tax=Mesoflavibacter zeaxanthinifaciens TaxID=393060 RepID=UPI003A940556